jgi:hypothetical protein
MNKKIEVPAAFNADCDNCFLVCEGQERVDRRPLCIARHKAYIEGYKAGRASKQEPIGYSHFMNERARLADKLLFKCSSNALDDHELIYDLVRRGEPLDEILKLESVSRYPETEALLKAALGKHKKQLYLVTRVTVFHEGEQREKTAMFVGRFDIDKGTIFNLDTTSGEYNQSGANGSRGLSNFVDAKKLQETTSHPLRKLEIRVSDRLVEGNRWATTIEGFDSKKEG